MELYKFKNLKIGFLILSPDKNITSLRHTVRSIQQKYSDVPCVSIIGNDSTPEEANEMGKICPVFVGKNTITSLINAGMAHAPAEWNIIVMAGVWIRKNLDKKYSYFVENKKDIIYSIIDNKYLWMDCSLNGIMIHKDTWNEVGEMCSDNPIPICKLIWADAALMKGVTFKGVIGTKIC